MDIYFKTVLSNLQKGGKPCYYCKPINLGTKTLKETAGIIAREINMGVPFTESASEIVLSTMIDLALKGWRVETENLSIYVSVRGGCSDTAERWDAAKHSLHLIVVPKGELRKKIGELHFINTTEGVTVTIYSAGDEVYNTEGLIAGTADETIKLAGEGFNFDATKEDEGVWMLDADRTIVQKLVVTAKTGQTIDCHPSEDLETGEGYIMVASRNGDPDKGVAVSYRKVTVMGPLV